MPKIEQYTARGGQGYVSANPGGPGPSPYEGLRGITEGVNKGIEVYGKMRAQADDMSAIEAVGKWSAGVKQIHLDMDTDETISYAMRQDPAAYGKEFQLREQRMRQDVLKDIPTGRAGAMFDEYLARHKDTTQVEANARGAKLFAQDQLGKLATASDRLSEMAARASTPEERDDFIGIYRLAVDRAEKRGFLTPAEAEKAHQDFDVKSQSEYMEVLGKVNPELMLQMDEETTAFKDVPPLRKASIVDRATRAQGVKTRLAEAALHRAMMNHRESVERATVDHISKGTLTQEWLDDWKEYWTSEKYQAYAKALREQTLGFKRGDPAVENAFLPNVYNPKISPQSAMNALLDYYGKGLIGGDKFTPWAAHLQTRIDKEDNKQDERRKELKADLKEGETRIREIRRNRYEAAMTNVKDAFQSTGSLSPDFDQISAEAATQFREELQKRGLHLGEGKEDEMILYRQLLPQYISHVQVRSQSRVQLLKDRIGGFKDIPSLNAVRDKLGEEEYYQKLKAFEELRAIIQARRRLEALKMLTPTESK